MYVLTQEIQPADGSGNGATTQKGLGALAVLLLAMIPIVIA